MPASAYFASHTNVTEATVASEQRQRILQKRNEQGVPSDYGGWTGGGILGFPHVQGKMPIDNHYLLVHLGWGRLGYYLFIFIVWENLRVLLVRLWQLKSFEDRAFMFSMLAAMAVHWITLLTVYLGGQLPQISFLLIGWMQSTGRPQTREFSYRRVFI